MTLETLAAEFESWRANRKHTKTPVPKRLWDMAVEMANKTSVGEAARASKVPLWKIKSRMGIETKMTKDIKFQKIDAPKVSASIEFTTPSGVLIRVY